MKSKEEKIILNYFGEKPQYLGLVKGKIIVIKKNLEITKKTWDKIKDRKWNKKLIELNLLKIVQLEDIDEIKEKIKKEKKRKEKKEKNE